MEICGSCGYIYLDSDEISSDVKSTVDLRNTKFTELVVGNCIGSYHNQETYEFGSKQYNGKTDVDTVLVCPNCGTIKLSGVNKEISKDENSNTNKWLYTSKTSETQEIKNESDEENKLLEFIGLCNGEQYIVKAESLKNAKMKLLVSMSKRHNLITCDDIECKRLTELEVIK